MRERRRKETKEKIRREEEMKGKKGRGEKEKKEHRDKANLTKVRFHAYFSTLFVNFTYRHNYWWLTMLIHLDTKMAPKRP